MEVAAGRNMLYDMENLLLEQVLLGPCHADTFHPDIDWLQQQLTSALPPKMVVIVNPCNPTGK
jgi:aspartate/methionine/tyrosine aminotransferase